MKALKCILVLLLIGILCGITPCLGAELVGLQNLVLDSGELVWGFDLELKEGRILAVCNIPEGWKITAENYGEAAEYKDGGGRIQGGADFGHDALSTADLPQLSSLLLIDRSTVHGKPAMLTGFITVAGLGDNREVQLQPQNFSRGEAGQCPAPPAASGRTISSSGRATTCSTVLSAAKCESVPVRARR